MRTRAFLAVACLLAVPAAARCGWDDGRDGPAAPLASLPSRPGEHVAKIKSLKDDAWLDLGTPAPDPTYGTARGRSWGAAMPYAPDLRAAFLFGEGQHGWWDRDTGRYMDDLWAYDCNAHRWVCVHPGSDVNGLDLKLNGDGVEVNRAGEPVPVAQMVHGYSGVAYDADRRRFQFMPCPGDYWPAALGPRRMAWLGDKHNQVAENCGPWEYDVRTAKWDRRPTGERSAAGGFGDLLIYIPTVKKTFMRHGDDVWWYDAAANKWTKVSPQGPPPPFGIDATACFDTKRNRIYVGGGDYPVADGPSGLWIYDVDNDTWIDPKPAGSCCGGLTKYSSNNAVMTYDQANDVVVVNKHSVNRADQAGLWVYDPTANAWEAKPRAFPAGLEWKEVNGFYDPELNVHVYHSAGDSEPGGTVWVYRAGASAKR